MITVLKNNVPTGPFTRAQVAERMHAGEFLPTDWAFMEGLSEWKPLSEVLARHDAVTLNPPGAMKPAPAAGGPVPAAYSYAATMQPPTHLVYGGFWLRFAAYCIDVFILLMPLLVIVVVISVAAAALGMAHQSSASDYSYHAQTEVNPAVALFFGSLELVFFAATLVAGWLYFAMLESGPKQATLGKQLVGVKVTDQAGARLSFGHATGRYFAKIVSGMIPFGLGYVMAAFTERKQALHDLIAGTFVVRTK